MSVSFPSNTPSSSWYVVRYLEIRRSYRRQHALSVWNAATAVLMALAIEKAAYDVGRYDGPRWEKRL